MPSLSMPRGPALKSVPHYLSRKRALTLVRNIRSVESSVPANIAERLAKPRGSHAITRTRARTGAQRGKANAVLPYGNTGNTGNTGSPRDPVPVNGVRTP